MFGMGMPEVLLILAIALIVIGPKKLPELAKSLGRAMREFKGATQEFKDALDVEDTVSDLKNPLNNLSSNVVDAIGGSETSEKNKADKEDARDMDKDKKSTDSEKKTDPSPTE